MNEGTDVVAASLSPDDVGIDGAAVGSGPRVWTGLPVDVAVAPLCTGEGGSSSSSDSESSLSDMSPPTVDGLLNGESGLSGPSSSSPAATGIVLAIGSSRRTRLGKILTGDGRRS